MANQNNEVVMTSTQIVTNKESVQNPNMPQEVKEVKLLSPFQLHAGSKLKRKGYEFARLKINRSLNTHALNLKKKSIKTVGGVITPILVVYAKVALEAGLELVFEDGDAVTQETSDLEKILVIIDGQHRREAAKELNKELGVKSRYETYYYFPLVPDAAITTMLREANVATSVWKGGDYLVSAITSAPDNVDCSLFEWVIDHMGVCGDTAAWLWATLDKSRVYSKQKIIKACKDVGLLKKMADTEGFDRGVRLYEAALKTLSIDLVKLKVMPEWVIGKAKYLSRDKSATEATGILETFFSTIKKKDVKNLLAIRKHGTLSKDHQIEEHLDGLFEQFVSHQLKSNTNIGQ